MPALSCTLWPPAGWSAAAILLLFGLALTARPATGTESPANADEPHAFPLLEKALPLLEDRYLHPEAANPTAMLRAAIQRTEKLSPQLLVLENQERFLDLHPGDKQLRIATDAEDFEDLAVGIREAVEFLIDKNDETLNADSLEIAALRGSLKTIDRHSRLYSGEALDEFNTRFQGTLVGIGARIGRRGGKLRVVEPFAEAPAGRAGLRVGDVISHVDGVSTAAMTVEEAVERIRGPEGLPVILTIVRTGEVGPRIFVIVREKVSIPTVDSEMLPEGIGLIRIDHFSQKTSREFVRHADKLRASPGFRGLVLDLRGNSGGSMRHAARIVNYFIPSGTLVRTEGRDGVPVPRLTPKIDAETKRFHFNGPVAVLVDGATASGAEIVAGGLKFLGRSLTIGTQTFGKGTVQKLYPLRKGDDAVTLKLTVARYMLPGDAFINSVGVTPDVRVAEVLLDPDEPTLPDHYHEPEAATRSHPHAEGLDARRNPGGGVPASRLGLNAAPSQALWYPRVLEHWGPPGRAPDPPPEQEAGDEFLQGEVPTDVDGKPLGQGELDPGWQPTEQGPPGWSLLPGDAGEPLFNDVGLRIAYESLLEAEASDRRDDLLKRSEPIVRDWQEGQGLRMQTAMALRQLHWAADPAPRWLARSPNRLDEVEAQMLAAPPAILARLHLPAPIEAGTDIEIHLEVKNTSDKRVEHLRAQVASSTGILDGASFLIGDLEPGETGTWAIPVLIPESIPTRLDRYRLYLFDDRGPLGGPVSGTTATQGGARPELALAVQSKALQHDDGSAGVEARIKIRNDGEGAAGEVRVRFGDPGSDAVERLEQWKTLPSLAPGESEEVVLNLRVRAGKEPGSIRVRARDRRTGVATTLSVDLPLEGESLSTGWRHPPKVSLRSPRSDPSDRPSAGGEAFRVQGQVGATAGLRSVEVYVGNDKVFSRVVPEPEKADDAKPEAITTLEIDAAAILRAGPNRVTVRTRTLDEVETASTSWVLGERSD